MKTIPVTIPYFTETENEAIKDVLNSKWVAQGSKVTEFEKRIAKHEGITEGVAVTSCTNALNLAMTVSGLGIGMDAIVPAFTFVATANAIVQTGGTPVFVDVCRETYNICIEDLERLLEEKYHKDGKHLINNETGNILWGIVPVHEFGLCCDIIRINAISKRYNLKVVEDAACALGAKIGDRHQGAFGNPSCISFHPRKSITTGEGGMVLTDDERLAKRMRELRTHGASMAANERHKGKGFLLPEFNEAGYNYRMTDIQAALGLAQADKLDFILGEKIKRASFYSNMIGEKIPELIIPIVPEGYFHTYQSYVCMLSLKELGLNSTAEGGKYRNMLLQRLEEKGIATRQGTHAVHMLGYYKNKYGYKPDDYPNAYACDHLSITLPLYVEMTDDDQKLVIDTIREEIDKLKLSGEKNG